MVIQNVEIPYQAPEKKTPAAGEECDACSRRKFFIRTHDVSKITSLIFFSCATQPSETRQKNSPIDITRASSRIINYVSMMTYVSKILATVRLAGTYRFQRHLIPRRNSAGPEPLFKGALMILAPQKLATQLKAT